MIKGCYYINLDRRTDRHAFMRFGLSAMQFSEDEIHRFPAVDGSRWKHYHKIAECATREFPFLEPLIANPLQDIHGDISRNPCNVAIQWTWCRLLTHLQDELKAGDFALCMTDEIALRRRKQDFESIIKALPDLHFLQVAWSHKFDTEWVMPWEHCYIDNFETDGKMLLVRHRGGISDQLLMVNREGATKLLGWIKKRPRAVVEIQPALNTGDWDYCYTTYGTDDFYLAADGSVVGSDRIAGGTT